MKKFNNSLVVLLLSLILFSCGDNKPSLQEYFVDKNQNPNFIALDIPTSILSVNKTSLSDPQKQAYESVKKLNVLAFKINQDNQAEYEKEKSLIKEILKDQQYQELMVLNSGEHRGVIKFLGSDQAIDEVIVFGSSDKKGFALVRVLGDNMKPENMMTLVEALENGTIDASGLGEQLEGVFGN